MTNNELKTLRMNLVGGMNEYIRELGDEDIWFEWISVGVPDEATEDDLEWIAEDEQSFVDVCRVFGKLVVFEWENGDRF